MKRKYKPYRALHKVAQFKGGDSIGINNELGVRVIYHLFLKKGGNEWLLREEIS